MDKLKKALPFIFPPLAVLLIMGFAFYRHGLYPFGDGTVSWCDMSQQVIPLLTDFKDIFTGKDGMFLNFHNAGGMNLWGVFFFFIASPYTLLVLFVDKADIIYLVNILTVLKMMTAAVTAQIYFRSCQKKARPLHWRCTQRHICILRLWNALLSEQHMARHDVSFPSSYGGIQGAF